MKNNMKYTILMSGEPYLFWSGNGVFLGLIALSYFAMFCNTANNASRLNENDDDFHRIEEQHEVTSPEQPSRTDSEATTESNNEKPPIFYEMLFETIAHNLDMFTDIWYYKMV